MKRIGCMIICIMMILTGMPAMAWGHPLDSEPFYDPASGVLSGTVFWTTSVQYEKDHPQYMESTHGWRYLIHSMNLDTGETRTYDMDDNYYLVYSDLPGVAVAKESDGVLYLYQMDLEGNRNLILKKKLFTQTRIPGSWLPYTAYAHYNGCLYYILSDGSSSPWPLIRIKEEGTLFAYRDPIRYEALSEGGLYAWFEYPSDGLEVITLFIQNPEDNSILEVPFSGEYVDLQPSGFPVWMNDEMLLFCSENSERPDQTYSLHFYNLTTGEIRNVKNQDNQVLYIPYGLWDVAQLSRDGSQILLMEFLYNAERQGTPCIIDMHTGREYKLAKGNGVIGHRAVWYND